MILVFMVIESVAAVEVSKAWEGSASRRVSTAQADLPARHWSPPSDDCFVLASRSFSIPFTVDPSGARPVEVRLYLSRGPRDEWKMLSQKRPDVPVPQFEFTADDDGEYWFATRTIDAAGNPHPPEQIQPQLKVFVDTTQPQVNFTVDASAEGEIDAVLEIDDATPIKELVIRYVTDKAKEWKQVNSDPLLTAGSMNFSPSDDWERISIQLIATDKAGNQTVVNRLVQRPRVAELPGNRYGASDPSTVPYPVASSNSPDSTDNPDANPAVSNPIVQLDRDRNEQVQYRSDPPANTPRGFGIGTANWPFRNFPGAGQTAKSDARPTTPFFRPAGDAQRPQTTAAPLPPGPERLPVPAGVPQVNDGPQFYMPPPSGDEIGLAGPQQTTQQHTAQPHVQTDVPPNVPQGGEVTLPASSDEQSPPRPRTATEAMRPLSEPSAVPKPEQVATPKPDKYSSKRPAPIEPPRAPVRHSDSERFSLEYELQAVGNLGVDAIELYGSVDNGQTWNLWGTDPDRVSPFDIETKEEGVFSFRIVVVGRNGLASPRPQAGESPDIVVIVDKQKPKVRITAAQYGEGNRIGALVIRYECIDEHLGPRPISLSFSDSTSGPWTTIAAGLENDGDYIWPADPKLPRRIYLRIDAKDGAGNVGSYVLESPIDVQGLAPRAKIRGFRSLSGTESIPIDEQTAERPDASFK
jgi:hypothetical protein